MIPKPVCVCVIICLTPCASLAQSASVPAAPEAPPGPRVVELTFTPAPAPVPALKYLLVPSYVDQEPGNGEVLFHTASEICDRLRYSAESEKLFEQAPNWVEMPFDKLPRDEVEDVLKQADTALHYARLAARREWCQWDIPVRSEGFEAMLPHLAPLRTIGRLLAIRTRIAVAEGRYDEAIDDLQTIASMANCLGEAPTFIHTLVGAAEARLLAYEVEHWIKQPGSPNLYWALTDLPRPLVNSRPGIQMERWWLYFDLPDVRKLDKEIMSPAQVRAMYDHMLKVLSTEGRPDSAEVATAAKAGEQWEKAVAKNHKQARSRLLSAGYDPAFVKAISPEQAVMLRLFDDYRKVRDDFFKLFAFPICRAQADLGRIEREIDEEVKTLRQEYGSGLFKELMPSLWRGHFLMARADRDITIVRVIEAIRLYAAGHDGGLPPTLDAITEVFVPDDPMTGEPFVYEYAGDHATLIGRVPAGEEANEVHFRLRVRE